MGTLFVVATPIGNLNDFSKRAVDTLKNADVVLAEDTRQTIKLLNYFDIKTKMLSYHKFNEKERTPEIIEMLKEGKDIALVSDAGTPCVSDPGFVIVKQAKEEKINVLGIPGASAVTTALSVSGLDTSSFTFYGFVPTNPKQKKELFEEIKKSSVKTKIIYESPKRIIKLFEDLTREMPGCEVCLCHELTKIHEWSKTSKVEDIYKFIKGNKDALKGEYAILISNDMPLKKENSISNEGMLVDIMVKEKCSLKDAIGILSKDDKINKNDVYKASLNVKGILK